MPFTPFHMGPAAIVKAVLQNKFSFIVFGISQIAMDLEPLFKLMTGIRPMHGITHTYIGAVILGCVAAVVGKGFSASFLRSYNEVMMLKVNDLLYFEPNLPWSVALFSAYLGTLSHVALDSMMHSDMKPLFPFGNENELLGLLTTNELHLYGLLSGIISIPFILLVKHLANKMHNKSVNSQH